jgi:type IV secretory pathway VirB4 component
VFKLAQITKEYNEAAALCSQINLFGFIDDEIFLTKSGDLGIVFSLEGIDYECLDGNTIENFTRRISAAFRIFDEKCHVYQYLFKRNRENIPHKTYQNPIVNAAIESRMAHLETKAESLYSFRIHYVVLYEGFRHKASILQGLGKLTTHPVEAVRELRALLSSQNQVLLMELGLDAARAALKSKARSFLSQVGDFVSAKILPKQEAFCVLKQLLNFSPLKIENARLTHDTFLDYYLRELAPFNTPRQASFLCMPRFVFRRSLCCR